MLHSVYWYNLLFNILGSTLLSCHGEVHSSVIQLCAFFVPVRPLYIFLPESYGSFQYILWHFTSKDYKTAQYLISSHHLILELLPNFPKIKIGDLVYINEKGSWGVANACAKNNYAFRMAAIFIGNDIDKKRRQFLFPSHCEWTLSSLCLLRFLFSLPHKRID